MPGLTELAVRAHLLGDLVPDSERRVQAGHGLLENHRDVVPAQLAHSGLVEARELLPFEADGTAHSGDLRRQQSHDRESRNGLARTTFPHESQRLSAVHCEVGVLHDREAIPAG